MFNSIIKYISNMPLFFKILWILLIIWAIWELVQYFRRKNTATALEADEFKKDIRRVQLIDVRDGDEFDAGHILGARNIPYLELKQRHVELRKDQPIYLYEQGEYVAYRAALELKKHGFEDLFVLRHGFEEWDGRTKKNTVIE